jgi:hypothetical protein
MLKQRDLEHKKKIKELEGKIVNEMQERKQSGTTTHYFRFEAEGTTA